MSSDFLNLFQFSWIFSFTLLSLCDRISLTEVRNMFGDKLKRARINAKLKQSELARILDTTNTTISNWENNVSKPDLDTIEYICGALNVPASYFFNSPDSESKVFTVTEQSHIKKYRALDEHGKTLVDNVLNLEYKRVTSQKSNEVTINIAARGGENELTLSEEKYQKLLQVIEENKDKEIPDIFD